jgi:hypothetical protein
MLPPRAVQGRRRLPDHGQKWFITGADGADYAIIMARMEDGEATMFLSDMDRPGIRVERSMDAMDSLLHRRPRRAGAFDACACPHRRARRNRQGLSLCAGAACAPRA